MPLSSETYRRLASDFAFQQDALEKVVRLGEIALEIGRHRVLAGVLTLKGGTALNLAGTSPPRLSVDLDFDYIGQVEREEMLQERPLVLEAIDHVASALGYQVVTKTEAAGTGIRLRYRNSLGTPDEIKLDISWTSRVQVAPPSRQDLWQPEGVETPTLLVSSESDLVGGKFRALIARVAARDVFDVARLAHGREDWPPPHLKAAFVFLTGTLSLPLTRYDASRLDRLQPREVQSTLLPMLRNGSELDIDVMKARALAALRPMLELNDNEREFVVRLHEGQLAPELLFSEDDSAQLRRHPHLLWKIANVRKHLGLP